jgi:hypothetical protein
MRVVLAFAILLLTVSVAEASDGTTLANGASQNITAFSVCKSVANNSGQSLYIPTTSSGEWSSFYNTSHTGVTIAGCNTTCDSFEYFDGYGYGYHYGDCSGSVITSQNVTKYDDCTALCQNNGATCCRMQLTMQATTCWAFNGSLIGGGYITASCH